MANKSCNEISKILNRIQGHDTYTVISDFFEISAIAVRNNVDCSKERDSYEQRYLSIVKKYKKEDLNVFVEALNVLKDAGINYAWNAFVDCGDIDARCVHMTYLTLSLLGVPAVVRKGDALALEYSETWYTPAYIFAWPHFKSRLRGGRYPATPTVQEAPQEPKTAPVADVLQEVAAPAPFADANGQYSLF